MMCKDVDPDSAEGPEKVVSQPRLSQFLNFFTWSAGSHPFTRYKALFLSRFWFLLPSLLFVSLVSFSCDLFDSASSKMKLHFLAFAFAFAPVGTLATSSTNSSTSIISQVLSNPASVGIPSLSSAEAAQLHALNHQRGEWNSCQLAVRQFHFMPDPPSSSKTTPI